MFSFTCVSVQCCAADWRNKEKNASKRKEDIRPKVALEH